MKSQEVIDLVPEAKGLAAKICQQPISDLAYGNPNLRNLDNNLFKFKADRLRVVYD